MSRPVSMQSFAFQFSPEPANTNIKVRNADSLDNEFRYYSKIVEDLTVLLTRQEDREMVPPWLQKLSTAAYNVLQLRDKRNRYMLMLCLSLTIDTIEGPFIVSPPAGVLVDLLRLPPPRTSPAEWELDDTWEEEVENYKKMEMDEKLKDEEVGTFQKRTGVEPKKTARMQCPFHRKICPRDAPTDKKIGATLDRQFRFLLNISRPYAALLFRSSDKVRSGKWLQRLCLIDKEACAIAKGVRNDYMMVLVGYLSNRCLIGPFQEYPVEKLLPLPEIAKIYAKDGQPITDPNHPRTAQFFQDMPTPVEGAFALIACTGDLYEPKYH